MARAAGELLAAKDTDDTLYKWDATNEEWDDHWTIGGAASQTVTGIAAVNATKVYVGTSDSTIREVQSASDATHFAAWGSVDVLLVSYQGKLYALDGLDLWEVDTTATDTRTQRGDVPGVIAPWRDADAQRLSTSDVGPIWIAAYNDGRTDLWEYNVADNSAYVVTDLPQDATAYEVFFHEGSYFVSYRTAATDSLAGDAYLFFASGGNLGSIGPIRSITGATAGKAVIIAGVIGDQIMVAYDTALWAYDLSSGGLSQVINSVNIGTLSAVTYGKDVFMADTSQVERVDTLAFSQSGNPEFLESGIFNFGYLGLQMMMTKVTVGVEAALVSGDIITVQVKTDGGNYTLLSGSMTSGETTESFVVSDSTGTIKGINFEIYVSIEAGSAAASPKIVSIDAEAIGVESRLEWIMAVDVTDNNRQQGQTVLTGLETLRTNKNVIAFSNPFDDDVYATADSHDVTIEEVTFPQENAGGDDYVVVRARATQTV